jgi:hypothetical protein
MATLQVTYPHTTAAVVDAEIAAVYGRDGPEISDVVAVTIASWLQSPGTVGRWMASFASGLPVTYDDLARDIYESRRTTYDEADQRQLDLLSTWALDRTHANTRSYFV